MIYVVRHGQTEMNSKHVLQGRSDHPLNENGIAQAEKTGKWFSAQGITFDCVFSSPLQRSIKTANLIAPGAPVEIDERLIEMDYGPFEGVDLKSPPQEIITFFSDFVNNPAPEGMEQLSEIIERTGAFLKEIAGETGNILISTHAIAMKGILECLTPTSEGSYWSKYIGNCAVYTAQQEDGWFTVPEELVIEL